MKPLHSGLFCMSCFFLKTLCKRMSEWNQGDPETKLIIPISRVVVQISHRRF